jgi:hypothetical protein
MIEAFPDLRKVQDDKLSPADLRSKSLLGSSVVLRAFAAAWYELHEAEWDVEDITDSFSEFADHMQGPVYPDQADTWFATGLFSASDSGVMSPNSRPQDFKQLTSTIVEWCELQPYWTRIVNNE